MYPVVDDRLRGTEGTSVDPNVLHTPADPQILVPIHPAQIRAKTAPPELTRVTAIVQFAVNDWWSIKPRYFDWHSLFGGKHYLIALVRRLSHVD